MYLHYTIVCALQVTETHVEWQQSSSPPASVTKPPPSKTASSQASAQIGQVNFNEMPSLITASPSKTKLNTPLSSPQQDSERLSSETKRILLRHREHAQTLSELVECFKETQDPACPTVNTLYQCLKIKTDKFKVYACVYCNAAV